MLQHLTVMHWVTQRLTSVVILPGGGLWHTASQPLGLLRRDIDRRPNRLKSVLTSDGFAAEFLDWSAGSDERAAIRAFAEHNKEDALKTAPKVMITYTSRLLVLFHCPRLLLGEFRSAGISEDLRYILRSLILLCESSCRTSGAMER